MPDDTPFNPPAVQPRIDWDGVALALGRGMPATQVARDFRCSRSGIWKKLRTDKRFRRLVTEMQEAHHLDVIGQTERMREKTAQMLEKLLDAGDARVVLWLANKFRIGGRDYACLLEHFAKKTTVVVEEGDDAKPANPSTVSTFSENPSETNDMTVDTDVDFPSTHVD